MVTVDDTADVDTVHWKGNSVEVLVVVKTFCAGGRTNERGADGDGCGEQGGKTSFSSCVVCCRITDDGVSVTVLFCTMPPPVMPASTRWLRCCSQPVVVETATVHVVATFVGGKCRETNSGCGLLKSQHGVVKRREGDEDDDDGSVVKCCCGCRLLLLLLVLWNT